MNQNRKIPPSMEVYEIATLQIDLQNTQQENATYYCI